MCQFYFDAASLKLWLALSGVHKEVSGTAYFWHLTEYYYNINDFYFRLRVDQLEWGSEALKIAMIDDALFDESLEMELSI